MPSSSSSSEADEPAVNNNKRGPINNKPKRRTYPDVFKAIIYDKMIEHGEVLFGQWTISRSNVDILAAWKIVLDYSNSKRPGSFDHIYHLKRKFGQWKVTFK
jgi:hypothetical protein